MGMIPAFLPQLEVVRAARSICRPGWRWLNHVGEKQEINIWVVEEGSVELQSHGKHLTLTRGDVVIQDLNTLIQAHNPHKDPYIVRWCDLAWRSLDQQLIPTGDSCILLPKHYRNILDPTLLLACMGRLITALQEENEALAASHWAAVILDELRRQDRLDTVDRDIPGASKIRKLMASIRSNPARPRSVAEMAASCGWTPGHFTRVFARITGTNPRDFLIDAKISAAQELLRMSNEGNAAIAERLGFVDVYHFAKRFRKRTGLSPGRFRRGDVQSDPRP